MARAAAEMEPLSRTLSSSVALPGPMRAPESEDKVSFRRAMRPSVPALLGRVASADCRRAMMLLTAQTETPPLGAEDASPCGTCTGPPAAPTPAFARRLCGSMQ